jgi:Cu/Ag efflux protein CusF
MRILPLVVLLLGLLGCARTPPAAPAKVYPMRGVVVRLDATAQVATIRHEKIDGWMEPMTMDFPVPSKEEFAKLKEGQSVRGEVRVQGLDFQLTSVAEDRGDSR